MAPPTPTSSSLYARSRKVLGDALGASYNFVANSPKYIRENAALAGGGLFHLLALIFAVIRVNKCSNNDWKMTLFALLLPEFYLFYHFIIQRCSNKADYCPTYVRA